MNQSTFSNPPGGLMVWIFISIECLTFGLFFLTYAYFEGQFSNHFATDKMVLDSVLATINTLVLVTSGLFMALAVHQAENAATKQASMLTAVAGLLGAVFLALKLWEYGAKFNAGIHMSTSLFFGFYYFLTLLHFLHVVLGIVILGHVGWHLWKASDGKTLIPKTKLGACYWHMCDLIWMILFPLIYLVRQ